MGCLYQDNGVVNIPIDLLKELIANTNELILYKINDNYEPYGIIPYENEIIQAERILSNDE